MTVGGMPKVGLAFRPSIGWIKSLVALNARTRSIATMSALIATATLFDDNSESDFTLLEQDGEYFVTAGNRTGFYREFVQAIFNDNDGGLFDDLVKDDVQSNFLVLMESLAVRWGDEFRGEIVQGRGA
jgi:hypothetical protein